MIAIVVNIFLSLFNAFIYFQQHRPDSLWVCGFCAGMAVATTIDMVCKKIFDK